LNAKLRFSPDVANSCHALTRPGGIPPVFHTLVAAILAILKNPNLPAVESEDFLLIYRALS